MPSFNQFTTIGHLTRDWEARELPGGGSVMSSAIACNHKYKTKDGEEREEVLFLDLSAFGKTGELLKTYTEKGSPLFVQGRLRLESWEDKNDGSKRSKISGVVSDFQFLSSKQQQDQQPAQQPQRQQAKVGASKTTRIAATDDIPF
jgi:single-strand DNA-binding protein